MILILVPGYLLGFERGLADNQRTRNELRSGEACSSVFFLLSLASVSRLRGFAFLAYSSIAFDFWNDVRTLPVFTLAYEQTIDCRAATFTRGPVCPVLILVYVFACGPRAYAEFYFSVRVRPFALVCFLCATWFCLFFRTFDQEIPVLLLFFRGLRDNYKTYQE